MKKKLKIPAFKTEDQEREFWASANLADYFEAPDFEKAIFPNLKPSSRSVSLRMPEFLLMRLKERAHELNIPYQTLMKQYIARDLLRGL